MSCSQVDDSTGSSLRRLWMVFSVAAVLTLGLVSVERAHGEAQPGSHNFCTPVWLQPFGQSGDRCSAGQAHWGRIQTVSIQTFERAGCVNYHGWYGEYYRSWACFGKGTSGYITVPRDGGSYIGIIRNNNQSYGGQFRGGYTCCYTY